MFADPVHNFQTEGKFLTLNLKKILCLLHCDFFINIRNISKFQTWLHANIVQCTTNHVYFQFLKRVITTFQFFTFRTLSHAVNHIINPLGAELKKLAHQLSARKP